jgi:hypothetical protein
MLVQEHRDSRVYHQIGIRRCNRNIFQWGLMLVVEHSLKVACSLEERDHYVASVEQQVIHLGNT